MDTEVNINETVYGSMTNLDETRVMSERVQNCASSVYKEFERMIKKYDEDVVKDLMPLVVGVLENLDLAFSDKQETEVELELLRDDNEQLLTQYEREKQLRKTSEQKCISLEDVLEEDKKESQSKIESLESIVRMFELKSKNSIDHIGRLEDKESEMRKEYSKLHERYTELFKTHMDYMERAKILMGTERMLDLANNTVSSKSKGGFQMPVLRPVHNRFSPPFEESLPVESAVSPSSGVVEAPHVSAQEGHQQESSDLRAELDHLPSAVDSDTHNAESHSNIVSDTSTKQTSEPNLVDEKSESIAHPDEPYNTDPAGPSTPAELTKTDTASASASVDSKSVSCDDVKQAKTAEDSGIGAFTHSTPDDPPTTLPTATPSKSGFTSIYDELNFNNSDALEEIDDGVDITGMGKEVENLILENTELLATKNALNVVKDDLISKVDELTSEQEILKEEISSLQSVKTRLKQRVSELEEEMKVVKDEFEKHKENSAENAPEEEDVPMAQRKRFTRVEMARVLMERNQYKERLMELQEAVRWTEMIRASKEHPDIHMVKKKSSMWSLFGNLVGGSNQDSTSNKYKSKNPPTTV